MDNDEVLWLYDSYSQDVFRFAYSYLNSYHDACDTVQDVYLKLLKSNCIITPGKEKSYILKMTANRCKDLIKSGKRNEIPFDELPPGMTQEADYFEESELASALKKLPESYRSVIHLHCYEELTVKETARILKLSVSCVSMRLTRAKAMIKEILKEDKNEGQL